MTIRSRLLSSLLPALTAIVGLIALFFYLNWSNEILSGFKTRLQSTVVATAQSIDPSEIEWLREHAGDPNLEQDEHFQQYRQRLAQLREDLPVDTLYIVHVEPVRGAKNQEDAYQQIFLLDASGDQSIKPGETDFSETGEHQVYFTKKSFVTPIYETRKTGDRLMSAYAPILNSKGDVIALLGADVSLAEIDHKLNHALLLIALAALFTMLLVIGAVLLIANKISRPVQQLNKAALDIAAGNYEADIHVKGPKEIVELANTFNTMGECLVENISRLRESSLIRERMHGEYECSVLLQHYMLQKGIDDFRHPGMDMKLISANFSNTQKGILLRIEEENSTVHLTWIEAKDEGFESLYELNTISKQPLNQISSDYPFIECWFKKDLFESRQRHLFPPLVWSIKQQSFIKGSNTQLYPQDMIFLYNSTFMELLETEEKIEKWFGKILRHFAEDGLETIHTMLTNELSFLAKRENLNKNFQILSIQV